MPDKRRHRGPHPADAGLFAAEHHPTLRTAVADLSWLLTRGYSPTAGLKLVGDHLRLRERQRQAVLRCACADTCVAGRAASRRLLGEITGAHLEIDGFNLLTTIEAALAGGVLLIGRDGCHRDLSSMHGSYRKVEESRPALELIGACLAGPGVAGCRWLFDRPVSNSGRIAALTTTVAQEHGWPWECELVPSPDAVLRASLHVVVSADSVILDACREWLDVASAVVERIPQAWIVDLRPERERPGMVP